MYMTMKEYAEHTKSSYTTIRLMCLDGRIPCVKIGNRRKIDPAIADAKLQADEQKRREQAETLRQLRERSARIKEFNARTKGMSAMEILTQMKRTFTEELAI